MHGASKRKVLKKQKKKKRAELDLIASSRAGEIKGMYEVQESKQGSGLIEVYREVYKARYHTFPIIKGNGHDHTLLKDLVRQHGADCVKKLLMKFVSMNDEWFIKQAHSLDCFSKNLHLVNAKLGISESNGLSSTQLKVRTLLYCDDCHVSYDAQVIAKELDSIRKRVCEECRKPATYDY